MTDPSLERIYLDNAAHESIAGQETKKLHLQRYEYAAQHLQPGIIGDIACGSGYGSYLVATTAPLSITKIIAVDNNTTAIAFAKKHYSHPTIDFIEHDALTFKTTHLFDSIISLETIEHLPDPKKFIDHLAGQLRKGGRFIASAPVTPSMDANPYHLQDFTSSSFKKLFLEAGFKKITSFIQLQPYNPFQLFGKKKDRTKEIRKGLLSYYIKHPGKFFLRISSVIKDGFCNKYLVAVFEKVT